MPEVKVIYAIALAIRAESTFPRVIHIQFFLPHDPSDDLFGNPGTDATKAVPDPSIAVAAIVPVKRIDYLLFNARIFIRFRLCSSLVKITALGKFHNFQKILELEGFSQDVNHYRFFAIAQGLWIAVLVFSKIFATSTSTSFCS